MLAPLYLYTHAVSPYHWWVFGAYLIATGLSITAGYHRLFSHRSYQAIGPVRLFYLIFGAAAFENSALKWASDHRRHHAYTDSERDPYTIQKGFFYAHIGWIFYKDPEPVSFDNVRDLQHDPLILWQHRHYLLISVTVGLLIPLLIGFLLKDPWGFLLLVGLTRIFIVHHSTFLVNSLAHYFGKRPYSLKDTARDNLLVSLLAYGEGYHNFHHRFPYDYRNGIEWYQWDPTKWWIRSLELIGCADSLRKVSDERIFRVCVEVQKQLVQRHLVSYPLEIRRKLEERLHATYQALLRTRLKWEQLKAEYTAVRNCMNQRYLEISHQLEYEVKMARLHFQTTHHAWSLFVQGCLQTPA